MVQRARRAGSGAPAGSANGTARGEAKGGLPTAGVVTLAELSERSWQMSCELGHMDAPDRFAAFVEEVGELAQALLVQRGIKRPPRRGDELDVAFAGVLFELLVLARQHGVDVERGFARGVATLVADGRLRA